MWNGCACVNCDGKRCTVCVKKIREMNAISKSNADKLGKQTVTFQTIEEWWRAYQSIK